MPDAPVTYYNRPITSAVGTTINIDFSRELVMDYESEAPLTTLLSKLADEKTETNTFKFPVGRRAPRSSTANGAVVAGAVGATAALTVVNGEYFVPGDVIEFPDTNNDATHTNQAYVVSIAGDVLTIRAYDPATYGVAAIDDGATVRRISSMMKEGSSGTNSSQTVPTVYEQYCVSRETYFDVTRIQAANRQYTHPERVRLREEARQKHVIDSEVSNFLSKKTIDNTEDSTKPRYQQAGIDSLISSNELIYGAALSKEELFGFMIDVHQPAYSAGPKRMVFASAGLLEKVNLLAIDGVRITPKDTTWGVQIMEVVFAGFIWEFIHAPTLSEYRDGWGFVVHPRFMKKRTLIPTVYEMNVQNPIDKFFKDGFFSVDAVQFKLEEVAGRIKP